jgi:hypothetical protein
LVVVAEEARTKERQQNTIQHKAYANNAGSTCPNKGTTDVFRRKAAMKTSFKWSNVSFYLFFSQNVTCRPSMPFKTKISWAAMAAQMHAPADSLFTTCVKEHFQSLDRSSFETRVKLFLSWFWKFRSGIRSSGLFSLVKDSGPDFSYNSNAPTLLLPPKDSMMAATTSYFTFGTDKEVLTINFLGFKTLNVYKKNNPIDDCKCSCLPRFLRWIGSHVLRVREIDDRKTEEPAGEGEPPASAPARSSRKSWRKPDQEDKRNEDKGGPIEPRSWCLSRALPPF